MRVSTAHEVPAAARLPHQTDAPSVQQGGGARAAPRCREERSRSTHGSEPRHPHVGEQAFPRSRAQEVRNGFRILCNVLLVNVHV